MQEQEGQKSKDMTNLNNTAPELKTKTRGLIGFGMLTFIALFIGGFAWASVANLSGAVIATGQVVVLGQSKTVQHLDGGIVADIRVDNGDQVKQNDLLIRLDDTLLKSNIAIYENRLIENVALQARLIGERDDGKAINWQSSVLDKLDLPMTEGIKHGQQKLFEARQKSRAGQIAQLEERLEQFKHQVDGVKALETSRIAQLAFLDEELSGIRKLSKQGLTRKSQLMGLERQREEIIGQQAEYQAEIARIQNAIGETKLQILQIDREFREKVLEDLRTVDQAVNDTIQQLVATREKLKRIDIRAPTSGIVHELSVFTIGGVIGAGNPVLQIVPQEEGFEIEANVEPQFVDELYPGQPATLRFSAFNQRTTPELNGSVRDISPQVIVDEVTGMTYYKIRLTLTPQELARLKNQSIIPGMPVESFIKTKNRTALNYLTKPLLDQINRAFREE